MPATDKDLENYGFAQIGTFSWNPMTKTMAVLIDGESEPPLVGIYAFAIDGEVCRIGTHETNLIARVRWRGTIVTSYHNGQGKKGLGDKEANRWLERLSACSDGTSGWNGGTIWARAGTIFSSQMGKEIDGAIAEERYFIRHHQPYMNTGKN